MYGYFKYIFKYIFYGGVNYYEILKISTVVMHITHTVQMFQKQ